MAKGEFELEYEELPIEVWKQTSKAVLYPADLARPAEYDSYETEIHWTYTLDADEVYNYFWDHRKNYEELEPEEGQDEYSKEAWLEENLEEMFDKYYEDLQDAFEEDARKNAEENYEPPEPDDYDYFWEED